MFRRYKIRRKANLIINLLKTYFVDKDIDVYNALCNCKRKDIQIAKREYVDKRICNDFDFTIMDISETIVIDSHHGLIYKVYVNEPTNIIEVVNFHNLLGLNDETMCTWDMIMDYLSK